MKRNLLKTGDGSFTLHIPEWNEQYHSKNGALTEALHVFIKEGLYHWFSKNSSSEISIMEMGFGTGLNSFLTYFEAEKNAWRVYYTGIEAYPLTIQEALSLNYSSILNDLYSVGILEKSKDEVEAVFSALHHASWEENVAISQSFHLIKQKKFFSEISDGPNFNLIYFDAFGIKIQPDLWTEEIFQKMYNALMPSGVLVTYAANGNARRAMQAAGFSVERLPGPPGKKEMLRATKLT